MPCEWAFFWKVPNRPFHQELLISKVPTQFTNRLWLFALTFPPIFHYTDEEKRRKIMNFSTDKRLHIYLFSSINADGKNNWQFCGLNFVGFSINFRKKTELTDASLSAEMLPSPKEMNVSNHFPVIDSSTTLSLPLIILTHSSCFQKPAELQVMFTFQMQVYLVAIILPALKAEMQLSGSRPASQHLISIHEALKEAQPLHLFAWNSFAAASAEKDSPYLSTRHINSLCTVLNRHYCPVTGSVLPHLLEGASAWRNALASYLLLMVRTLLFVLMALTIPPSSPALSPEHDTEAFQHRTHLAYAGWNLWWSPKHFLPKNIWPLSLVHTKSPIVQSLSPKVSSKNASRFLTCALLCL